jgi:hypothetical protein
MPQPRYAVGVRIVQLISRSPGSASVNQKINTPYPPSYIFKTLHIITQSCETGE